MAGSGVKLFVDGEDLNAAEANGYFMDQSIMRFATTAARDAAFGGVGEPALAEGMTCYIDADNGIYSYNGGSWVKLVNSTTPPGLELVKVQAVGSAVTSQECASCFTADFDSYRVVLNGIQPSTSNSFVISFGSGTPTTDHYSSMYYDRFDGAVTNTVRSNNTGIIYVALNEGGVISTACAFDIHSPFLAQKTMTHGTYSGRGFFGWAGGLHNLSVSYSGFTLRTDGAGTMTGGTIRVYGYRNAIS